MANLNPKENGRVSMFALAFILFFNVLSACIGVAYAFIINPGKLVLQVKFYARENDDYMDNFTYP